MANKDSHTLRYGFLRRIKFQLGWPRTGLFASNKRLHQCTIIVSMMADDEPVCWHGSAAAAVVDGGLRGDDRLTRL